MAIERNELEENGLKIGESGYSGNELEEVGFKIGESDYSGFADGSDRFRYTLMMTKSAAYVALKLRLNSVRIHIGYIKGLQAAAEENDEHGVNPKLCKDALEYLCKDEKTMGKEKNSSPLIELCNALKKEGEKALVPDDYHPHAKRL